MSRRTTATAYRAKHRVRARAARDVDGPRAARREAGEVRGRLPAPPGASDEAPRQVGPGSTWGSSSTPLRRPTPLRWPSRARRPAHSWRISPRTIAWPSGPATLRYVRCRTAPSELACARRRPPQRDRRRGSRASSAAARRTSGRCWRTQRGSSTQAGEASSSTSATGGRASGSWRCETSATVSSSRRTRYAALRARRGQPAAEHGGPRRHRARWLRRASRRWPRCGGDGASPARGRRTPGVARREGRSRHGCRPYLPARDDVAATRTRRRSWSDASRAPSRRGWTFAGPVTGHPTRGC